MAEKKRASNLHPNEKIIEYNFEDLMGDRFGRYAKYIIQERALPDVRDGLKPVQRRILYGMKMLKLTADHSYMKSARVVGDVMGKYHPHGDSSIYEALVRMSQDWKMGLPLIDMQGNNGSMDGDPAAAYRYTESRLQKVANYLLTDLDKNAVEFAPNYDDKDVEPTVLPAFFPNILVNGSTGIAAGYATNMPPHNLGEVIDATIAMIENPNITLEELMQYIKAPDFPTGGILQNLEGVKEAFSTGKGKLQINAKWHTDKDNLIIDEIPYEVVKQDLVKKIGEISDNNPGLGIKDILDETDKTGLKITIKLNSKNEFNPKDQFETVRKFLFKNTQLSISYNYNNVVIINKQPKQVGLIQILKAYLNHYVDVYTRKTNFELDKASNRLEIIDGLINAMSILDEVIAIIRASENRKDAIKNLVEQLKFEDVATVSKVSGKKASFTKVQAEAIVDMRLYRLTSTDVVLLKQEKANLEKDIINYNKLLTNKAYLNKTIIKNLEQIKEEYPIKRRSQLSEVDESFEVDVKDTVVKRTYQLFVSQDGYLKAVDPASFEKNDITTFGRKPGDLFITNFEVSNMDHLLLVSSKGLFYSIPLFKINPTKWRDLGVHVNQFASMSGDVENIVSAIVVPNFKNLEQQLLVGTKKGLIKRVLVRDLETKQFNKSFRLIRLDDDDIVVSAELIDKKTNGVVVVSQTGYGVRYDLDDIPIQGTNSKGVKASTAKDNIVGTIPLAKNEYCLLITNNDRIKKLDQDQVPLFIRPKKGSRLYPEKQRGEKELVNFVFRVDNKTLLNVVNNENTIAEFETKHFKLLEIGDKPLPLDFKHIVEATVFQNFVTDNSEHLSSTTDRLNELENEENKTQKMSLTTKKANNQVNLKDKMVKAEIDQKYAANDLYSMFDSFKNEETIQEVDETVNDTLDLDLDDLVDN